MNPLVVLLVLGGIVLLKNKAATTATSTTGPAINPLTHLVIFGRFADVSLAPGLQVQVMQPNGFPIVATLQAASPGAVGQPLTWSAMPLATTAAPTTIYVQAQDVAAVAPAGASPTDASAWATSPAALVTGPPFNPLTNFLMFNRFQDSDIGADDVVQLLDPSGLAMVCKVAAAQSSAQGPVWVGLGTKPGAQSMIAVMFQSQDVAAIAPPGTSPTDSSKWATTPAQAAAILAATQQAAQQGAAAVAAATAAPTSSLAKPAMLATQ